MKSKIYKEIFSKNLKAYRLNKNLSQEELAFQIGCTQQQISKWATGILLPSLMNLVTLSASLNISIHCLLGLGNLTTLCVRKNDLCPLV